MSATEFSYSNSNNLNDLLSKNNKTIVLAAVKELAGNPIFDEKIIRSCFSEDYIQYVDARLIRLPELIKQTQEQKKVTQKAEVEVKSVVSEGETVFANHLVRVAMKDNAKHTFKVLSWNLLLR